MKRISRFRIILANWIAGNIIPKYLTSFVRLRAAVFRHIGGLKIGRNVRMYGGTYIFGTNLFRSSVKWDS